MLYKGATAEFVRAKPNVGPQPSAGGTLVGIMGPLHFGNFAGMLSKAIWFGLGFAMCYVTYTGMRLWVVRRRDDTGALAWLERTLTAVLFGLPFGLVAAAAAFLVAMPLGSAVYWTTTAFLIASGAAILAGAMARSNAVLTTMLKVATGGGMLALPLLRLFAAGGPGWAEAIAAGQPVIAALDLVFVIGGAWLVRDCWTIWPRASRGFGPILGSVKA